MLDLKTSLLIVVALTIIVIGLIIYLRQRKNPATLAFAVFTVGISLWALTNALFQVTTNHTIGIVAALASYFTGILITLPFYSFSANFPYPLTIPKQKKLTRLLWIYGIIWGFIIGIPGVTLRDVVYDPTGRIITGLGLYFYGISLGIFLVGGMVRLWVKRRQAQNIERRQISLILIGVSISTFFGMICNLLLPIIGDYRLVWLGPDFALVLIVLMAYAIIKHGLFDLRILATEIFTIALGLVIVVELLRSSSTFELGIRFIILLVFIFIAQQMLKSVYEAIRAKEALRIVNEELQQVNAELQELLNIKTDFIHAASHQLRTPLTAIRGLLTMDYEGDYDNATPEERKSLQRNVLTAVERLGMVVNDLLRAAELEQGLTGETVLGDVTKLVEQSIETLRPNFIKKGVKLDYEKPTIPLPQILMHENYLQQVFLNLLDNAERYSPTAGTVVAKLKLENNVITFCVQDDGIGFTKEDEKKMFTKFGRTAAAKSAQPNGSGLGLFIVKRIVEEHGGTITAQSQGSNKGALFTVKLPLHRT
ncbi:MAG: hypothetical protein ACD_43C00094G0003 [uncultured bacterium]|nr:MAG: hypothetical protein ACD_43C00094G0003 [uncultured bacterium]